MVSAQPFMVGVMVIVLETGSFVEFWAVKVGMSPLPNAANPIEGLLFVQENCTPDGVPVIVFERTVVPTQ